MSRLIAFITRYLYAALSCLYLFTLGVLREKNRLLISSICAHFGYGEKSPAPLLPKIGISELAPEDLPIQIRSPVEADGNISLVEIAVISKLIRSRNPAVIFEIGTFDGRTTLNMAANSSPDAKIYTLDLPSQSRTELPDRPGRGKIHRQRNVGHPIHRHRLRAENNPTLRRFRHVRLFALCR